MARFGRLGDSQGRQTVRFSGLGVLKLGYLKKKQSTANSQLKTGMFCDWGVGGGETAVFIAKQLHILYTTNVLEKNSNLPNKIEGRTYVPFRN